MARTIVITDDLDGTPNAEEVRFTWDGVEWAIDLAEGNRKKLEEALKPFLDKAHPANVAQAKTVEAPRRGRRRTEGGRTDYSSPEYAGNPHRGRVTEAEAAYVREHFDEVNARLSREGLRTLDRSDPKVRERYGL
jgi:Lsr2